MGVERISLEVVHLTTTRCAAHNLVMLNHYKNTKLRIMHHMIVGAWCRNTTISQKGKEEKIKQ